LTDDLQEFGGCRLPFQPLLHLAELAHVFYGDDGLGGEGLQQ
jgi:hypothetical protein